SLCPSSSTWLVRLVFFFQAEDGIRDFHVTGVQTCALPISSGLPAHSASSFPPPKRLPSPAASTATAGSAMWMQGFVSADDLGQHGYRQHARFTAVADHTDRRTDAVELFREDATRGKTLEPSAPRLQSTLCTDMERGRRQRPLEDRRFPFMVVEQQHDRGP